METNLSLFEERELSPAILSDPTRAFPDMYFRQTGERWVSKYHLDGEKDGKDADTTNIFKDPHTGVILIKDFAQETHRPVTLFRKQNSLSYPDAIKELAKRYDLQVPYSDPKAAAAEEAKQERFEEAQREFAKALWSGTEEAAEILDYLHGRKWTDAEIKAVNLGLITKELQGKYLFNKKFYNDGDYYLGTTHKLAIPFRNGSRIIGFSFRQTGEAAGMDDKVGKYLNSKDLDRRNHLIGISPFLEKDAEGRAAVIMVEGYLDVLHALSRGIRNIAAYGGGDVSTGHVKDAVRRGATEFIILSDNDDKGKETLIAKNRSAGSSIRAIRAVQDELKKEKGDDTFTLPIYVAEFPNGCKDLDEYLATHGKEDFEREIIAERNFYSLYRLKTTIEKYAEIYEEQDYTLSDPQESSFFADVRKSLNSPYLETPEQKYKLREYFLSHLNDVGRNREAYEEWLESGKDYEAQELKKQEALAGMGRATALLQEGKFEEAIRAAEATTSKLRMADRKAEYETAFAAPVDFDKYISEIKDGIPTGFVFLGKDHQEEELTLNTGLTFICGYRGHGKTTFLNNIALNEATRNIQLGNGKSVFYFSYEVDKRRLFADFLTTFVNDPESSQNPTATALTYLRSGKDTFSTKTTRYGAERGREREILNYGMSHRAHFDERKNYFVNRYLKTGALRIVEENYKVEDLLDAIKYYSKVQEPSIVCIDYAQLIYSKDYSRQRTEEIKKVVNDIKDYANKAGIPFVLAAQFNREVITPLEVDTRNIGEGGDFERIADTCIGLFNLKELPKTLAKGKEPQAMEIKSILENFGIEQPKDTKDTKDTKNTTLQLKPVYNKIFVRLMKRRYGLYPLDMIVDFQGKTKYIKPTHPEKLTNGIPNGKTFDWLQDTDTQGELFDDGADDGTDDLGEFIL